MATSLSAQRERPIDRLLDEHGEDHRRLANILIHAAAVPMIVWSALALLSRIPFPAALGIFPGFGWSFVAAAAAMLYYVRLSVPLTIAAPGCSSLSGTPSKAGVPRSFTTFSFC